MIVVILPWPNPKLNPNSSKGRHWKSTVDLRKSARAAGYYLASPAAKQVTFAAGQEIPLSITFVQPDRRHRDRDNLLAACKPALDGVADALGVNDSQFNPMTICREYGGKPGSVRIEIGKQKA